MNKGSRDNNSSTELLENREDDVGPNGNKGRHEDWSEDTNGTCDQNDEQHSYANADLVVSVLTTTVARTALFRAITTADAVPVAR